MLDGLFRSTFRTKCKSLLNRTKTRLEGIKKRRNAMQKFLKKDIAELLKSNLDNNAYGRAEGLYMELNLSACYAHVEQCCACIAENLKEMHKQSECPEQCRVAVSSLTYAAARFADLPELRDLRNLFDEKYGKAVEPFADKEFVERLKYKHPTTKMKLQLMQEIAQEYSVTWDPSQLEKQVQSPTKGKLANLSSENGGRTLFRNRSTLAHGKGKQTDDDKQIGEEDPRAAKNRRHYSISGLKENISDKSQEQYNIQEVKQPQSTLRSTSEDNANQKPISGLKENISDRSQEQYNIQEVKQPQSSLRSTCEDNANQKPFADKIVPAPYTITINNTNEESGNQKNEGDDTSGKANRPRPRSVRTKFLKPSASTSSATTSTTSSASSEHINGSRESLSARVPKAGIHDLLSDDEEDQEEVEQVDKLLSLFGKKKLSQSNPPTSARKDDNESPIELPPPPGRRRYLFSDNPPDSPNKEASEKSRFVPPGHQKQYPIRHVKSASHLNDETGGHQAHPKLPDFDVLSERMAVLKHF